MYKNIDEEESWTEVIKSSHSVFDLRLHELWRYRDLILLFVKRDYASMYKQTVLGPLWYIIQPLLTTLMFVVVFNRIAKIPIGGAPPVLFYLCGITIWTYFSSCLTKTSTTFISNSAIFGKVYFPRLTVPVSIIISNLITFGVQFLILVPYLIYFQFIGEIKMQWTYLFFLPLLILIMGGLGMGSGIIISSLTTKYRDLTFLLGFAVQLIMYVSAVIIPLQNTPAKYRFFVMINPMVPIIEGFRFILLGSGEFNFHMLAYSLGFMILTLIIGALLFNKVEKSFMDTV